MNISIDILFQIISIIGTAVAVVWYMSNVINQLKSDLIKADQLNDMQGKQLEAIEQVIQNNSDISREGRIDIWRDLNALKLKVAKLEGKDDR
tara:strand:- start:4860 stop:5135 length:276 start_codon:yes stop_codon:yes gene_type:complete